MKKVYYDSTIRRIYVDDQAGKTTHIDLPADLDPIEIAYVLESDTMRSVLEQLAGDDV
ncbi:hypothetical protein [Sporosarcina sp. A2]|uniref:hypothetical protein n=1 Tax=Sporosarcina sp. A2 TaxID=3393449 RepID=UPI003D7939D7